MAENLSAQADLTCISDYFAKKCEKWDLKNGK